MAEVESTIELPQERRRRILEKLQQEGQVIATELSRLYGVSEDTIRRDLRELAGAGLLQRVHGGALPRSPSAAGYTVRQKQSAAAKVDVARVAAKLVRPNQVVIFDGGTTILEVARHLQPHLQATAVTTSPQVAAALADYPNMEIILIGGRLDKHNLVTVGAAALESLKLIQADLCLFGVCSLHPEIGITALSFEEVALKQRMIAASGDVVAVVTADKFGAAAPYIVAPINQLTHIVTEAAVSAETLRPYREAGIEIIQA